MPMWFGIVIKINKNSFYEWEYSKIIRQNPYKLYLFIFIQFKYIFFVCSRYICITIYRIILCISK